MSRDQCPYRFSRRAFLTGTAVGLAAGVSGSVLGLRHWLQPDAVVSPEPPSATPTPSLPPMPGRYPGRVIEVHHPDAVRPGYTLNPTAIAQMMDRGMCSLTGADDPVEAWRSFVEPGDVVGIKVNPVGFSDRPGVVSAISSMPVVLQTVRRLKEAGIRGQDIILFERYANEFERAGYVRLLGERGMEGVRWYCASAGYSPGQLAIDGVDAGRQNYSPELLQHVVGYDPDSFVSMGFAAPEHSPRDDRRFRSHLSLIVSRMVNKFITIPVLKDHRSAGVTLALKNMSHGLNNNVARSHLANIAHGVPDTPGYATTGPNQCNTFIPSALAHPALRRKAMLHILDGLIGVYEGGPGTWNRTWAVWPCRSLFFATDPVALDHVCWDIIERKRVAEGWPRTADMGRHRFPAHALLAAHLQTLGAGQALGSANAHAAAAHIAAGASTEVFDRRQPEHIYLAGSIGLGIFDMARIDHRRIQLGAA
jgi:hypothetical protein